MARQFKSLVEEFADNRVYGRHFRVPEEVVEAMLLERADKRVIIRINDSEGMHAGIMPKKTFHYILLNKEVCKNLGLEIGDTIYVDISPDHSKYGMDLPRELEEFLVQDETFSEYFEALSPGMKRNLIYIVAKIKSSDKRIEKARIIAHHLTQRKGDLDFKILNQDFKTGI